MMDAELDGYSWPQQEVQEAYLRGRAEERADWHSNGPCTERLLDETRCERAAGHTGPHSHGATHWMRPTRVERPAATEQDLQSGESGT